MNCHILLFQGIADLPLGVLNSWEDTVGYSWVEGAFWVLERRKGG